MPNFRTLENLAAENDSPGPVPPPLPSQYPAEDGGPARRLAHVAEKFSKFYSDLEHEKNARREVETGRRNALYDQVQKLELDLETEIRRRQESDRLLQEKVAADLKAMEQGMRTLRMDGWEKVKNGITTIEEVLRVTQSEEHMELLAD